jgi:hypothetical protein
VPGHNGKRQERTEAKNELRKWMQKSSQTVQLQTELLKEMKKLTVQKDHSCLP